MITSKEKLKELIHSRDSASITQGLVLLDSLKLSPLERAEILDFSDQNISLKLESVNLSYANFSNAVLRGNVQSCDLSHADCTGAWIAVKIDQQNCNLDEMKVLETYEGAGVFIGSSYLGRTPSNAPSFEGSRRWL